MLPCMAAAGVPKGCEGTRSAKSCTQYTRNRDPSNANTKTKRSEDNRCPQSDCPSANKGCTDGMSDSCSSYSAGRASHDGSTSSSSVQVGEYGHFMRDSL